MLNALRKYEHLFKRRTTFPKDQGISHVIELESGTKPPYRHGYRLSPRELAEVENMIRDLLAQGLIAPSSSPYGAPILFVNKPDGSLRMVIDYRQLNSKTVKQRLHMPLISQLLDQLHGAKWFSGLDLLSGYNQIPLRAEDIPKTQFVTPFGTYSYKVMSLGLSNAPSTFQNLMNQLFRQHLGKIVLVYMDDLIVFGKTQAEHAQNLATVLKVLHDAELHVSLKKCTFEKQELKFLGHIVGKDGIKVDPAKTKVIQDWPRPCNVKDVRSYCCLSNYFRRFLENYSTMVAPLTNLTRKGIPFDWTPACEAAFLAIKTALTEAPVLAMPDFGNPFEMEVVCDASIQGIGAVLTQFGRPIAFESRKLTPTEVNWTTGDQELWSVIHALNRWACYLDGIHFKLITDHQPLTYLQSQPSLSRRQARWSEYLQRFNYTWEYRSGKTNVVADALSRHPDFALNSIKLAGMSTRGPLAHPTRRWLERSQPPAKRKRQQPVAEQTPPVPAAAPTVLPVPRTDSSGPAASQQVLTVTDEDPDIPDLLRQGYDVDPWFAKPENLTSLRKHNGLWYRQDQLVVPNALNMRAKIMYELHDAPYSGHVGITKTEKAVTRLFWWPRVRRDVTEYVRTCASCQRNKASNQLPSGLLQPLPIPDHPWDSVSMDFITQLPPTKAGYDTIFVVVDRLTKMTHLAKCKTTISSEGTAQLFVDTVWKHHGVPLNIISDRGSVFVGSL